jgi:signal transduction histidine kinase
VAMLGLVVLTLVLAGAGSYVFVRHAALSTARSELAGQGRAISATLAERALARPRLRRELAVLRQAGAFTGIRVVYLDTDGAFTGTLPSGLVPAQVDATRLARGLQTSGTAGMLVFTAVPTQLAAFPSVTPVLVITRRVHDPAEGLQYFLLVGLVSLAVATTAAAALARRFSQPIRDAVTATGRIAAGDLGAGIPVPARGDPEVVVLADAINRMATDLRRARDHERQFLLSVSHELRTPLTSIRGYAEALADGTADDVPGAASVILAESDRLGRLVADLLGLARLEADRFTLRLGPVDLAAVAAAAAEAQRPLVEDAALSLVVSAPVPGPVIEADPDRLAQVVANLVENATRYAASRVEVGVRPVGAAGPGGIVWVADDGPGIAASDLPHVFERHFTSDRAGTRRIGTGLGLAIVAELVGAMGGSVRAESPVGDGRGTRLVVTFVPTAPGAGWTSPPPPHQPPDGAAPGGP